MSIKKLNTRIQLKVDSLANWNASTFVPLEGEVCFVKISTADNAATTAPTILFKVGDGINKFTNLKWGSALAADVYAWAKEQNLYIATGDEATENGKYIQALVWDATSNDGKGGLKPSYGSFATSITGTTTGEGDAAVTTYDNTSAPTVKAVADFVADYVANNVEDTNTKYKIVATESDTQYVHINDGTIITATDYAALTEENKAKYSKRVTGYQLQYQEKGTDTWTNAGDANVDLSGILNSIDALKAEDNSISLTVKDTPNTGYLKTYTLLQGGAQVGEIDIPKDFLVKSGKIVTYDDDDAAAAAVGTGSKAGKYLDLVINVAVESEEDKDGNPVTTNEHVYIAVTDLVDVYTANNANNADVLIDINDENGISATLSNKVKNSLEAAIQSVTGDEYVTANQTQGTNDVTLTAHTCTIEDAKDAQGTEGTEGYVDAVDGLATALDVKKAIESATPNIVGEKAISVDDGTGTNAGNKVVSVKLNDVTAVAAQGTQGEEGYVAAVDGHVSGLKQSDSGLEVNEELVWVFNCGDASENINAF